MKKNQRVYDFSKYCGKNYRDFTFKNFDEFSSYFYKTDHHWNYKGQYKGYTEIIGLLLGDDEKVLRPVKTIDFKTNFYGSMARVNQIESFNENFKAYQFDLPKHNEYINRKLGKYGKYEEYYKGNIRDDIFLSHYNNYYGDDQAEVIYDFYDNKDKDNLLIVGNSHERSVAPLIASHFHKTYMLDLRFYENQFNEKFSYKEYIKDNKIDKVLILGDFSQFSYLDLGLNGEEEN